MSRNARGLFELMQASLEEGTAQRPAFPMKETQHDMLRAVVEQSQTHLPPFKRGDPVHYFSRTGALKSDIADGLVWVFWRYLDEATPEDRMRLDHASDIDRLTLPNLDCLVACFTGETFRFDLCSSRVLIPGDK